MSSSLRLLKTKQTEPDQPMGPQRTKTRSISPKRKPYDRKNKEVETSVNSMKVLKQMTKYCLQDCSGVALNLVLQELE
jgi:hypothetical protein